MPGRACARSIRCGWALAAGCGPTSGRCSCRGGWQGCVPGASAFIIAGLRQALVRAFIAVIGAEMIAASDWGLGWVIFDAKEFLNADVMLAALIVIGAIGFALERLAFGALERATVMRWGMVQAVEG